MSEFFEATPADLAVFEAALDGDGPVESAGMRYTRAEHDEAQEQMKERIDDFQTSTAARISTFALHSTIRSLNSLMALRTFVTIMSVDVE
jgi:hypothetical protein